MSPQCPYCAKELAPTPKRKTRCPHCSNFIFVRAGRLLTEDEASIEDWLVRLAPFKISKDDFKNHRQQLSEQLGLTASVSDTIWQLLNIQVSNNYDSQTVQWAYGEMAQLASMEGKDPKPYQAEASRAQLNHLKSRGIKTVKIVGVNDEFVCENCQSLHNKEIDVEIALRDMPIPTVCKNESGCRCFYGGIERSMPELKPLPSKSKPPTPQLPATRKCPYCAETIQAEALVCRFCGRQVVKFNEPQKPKKWYFAPEIKILAFLFFTPFWTLIVLDDPSSSLGVKVVAIVLLVIFILFALGVCQGLFFAST